MPKNRWTNVLNCIPSYDYRNPISASHGIVERHLRVETKNNQHGNRIYCIQRHLWQIVTKHTEWKHVLPSLTCVCNCIRIQLSRWWACVWSGSKSHTHTHRDSAKHTLGSGLISVWLNGFNGLHANVPYMTACMSYLLCMCICHNEMLHCYTVRCIVTHKNVVYLFTSFFSTIFLRDQAFFLVAASLFVLWQM